MLAALYTRRTLESLASDIYEMSGNVFLTTDRTSLLVLHSVRLQTSVPPLSLVHLSRTNEGRSEDGMTFESNRFLHDTTVKVSVP